MGEIDDPETKKKANWKRKRKKSDDNDDVSVESVCSEPSIVDTSDDLDDESEEEEEEEDDDDNNGLNPQVCDINWEKESEGLHKSIPFEGITPTHYTREKDKRNGFARAIFFRNNPTPWDCFTAFLPLSFVDQISEWTSMKTEKTYNRADILGDFAIWFIYGLVTLPSIGALYARGLAKELDIIGIEQRHIYQLPKEFVYNILALKLQYNLPARKEDWKGKDDKIDLLYLIRPLLKLMQRKFPLA